MIGCPDCNAAMVRADLYEPEGTVPLHGGIRDEKHWWICIRPECLVGKRNVISALSWDIKHDI